jgi:hypothetical protein
MKYQCKVMLYTTPLFTVVMGSAHPPLDIFLMADPGAGGYCRISPVGWGGMWVVVYSITQSAYGSIFHYYRVFDSFFLSF